ncbi:MAG TPA: lmo0937 family membrane protein [Candidatus Obscuribacterales bacterium]
MLYTLITLILFVWLLGMIADFGGGLIHGLLVLAGILFLFQLFTGRSVSA